MRSSSGGTASNWDAADPYVGQGQSTSDSYDNPTTGASTWDTGATSGDATFDLNNQHVPDGEKGDPDLGWPSGGGDLSGHREYNDSDIVDNALNGHGPMRPSTAAGAPAVPKAHVPGPKQVTGPAYCGVVGVVDFAMGGVAGAGMGFFHTFGDAFQHDLFAGGRPQPGLKQYLAENLGRNMRRQAFMFGGWLAVYKSTKCMAVYHRGKADAGNSFLGGAAAGAVMSVASGNPRVLVGAAIANGSVMFILDMLNYIH